MAVSIWAVLGVVLVLIGIPLTFAGPAGNYVLGAGGAFLIVAVSQWAWNRGTTRDNDAEANREPS